MTPEQAESYLQGLINVERLPDLRRARLSLEPVRALLTRLGEPQRGLSLIHVAGSKGKGSTALLCEALLRELGFRVGTFTSPHLRSWTERFRIDGRDVSREDLAAVVARLQPHVDALRAGSDAPSFFDATTAAALLLFAEAALDHVVLEVGLGGRLDSTNVVSPAVCCITGVELEHTEKLGETLAEIAAEKAGILKPGVPAVAGALSDAAARVVEGRAAELGAPLARAGRDFDARVLEERLDGSRVSFSDGALRFEAELGCVGAHQAGNAALALASVRRLSTLPDGILAAAAARAFAHAELPGRVQVLSRSPWIVVDAAHTPASARALARVLARIPRRQSHVVLSVSAGKDLDAICRHVVGEADRVTVTRADPFRSLTPEAVASAVRAIAPAAHVRVVPNPHLALRAAREAQGPADLLCATGSVYLAGIALCVLGPQEADAL